ncbi:hypothetical protein UP09_03245 [Bradyrhizobium sp. LTSP885]|uniref:SGNH/GDSL hydrolase family protein n=1 Tax=Bradyrhizobium sp. LTSP885 TaxID=1619232 RepID=UPI0005C89F8E|nr:SGNH/GDSL hydrolase family protein [Bradyrhizobium sp. LTSP885]KJC51075.1 hypothetical protein UP09_03245 [Bradyrhizobium sp. LTSP885]
MPKKPFRTTRQQEKLDDLYKVMREGLRNNPFTNDVMASPPTVTVGTTGDGTLTLYPVAAAGALTDFSKNQVAWYGGVPSPILTQYVCMPVTSVLPSTNGNIGSGYADKNQWMSAFEIVTPADKVQLGIFCSSAVKIMFQVEDKYVDKVGFSSASATNADTMFLLTFPTITPRRIRVLVPCLPSKGPCFIKTVRVTPGCGVWKPSQRRVKRLGWFGDSYPESTNSAASVYPIPNASWPIQTGERLGIRDVRQYAVGQTGYIATAGGTRPSMLDLIPLVADQGACDIYAVSHGYNDATQNQSALEDRITITLQELLRRYQHTPVCVHGCQAGNAAPALNQIATENTIYAAVKRVDSRYCEFIKVSTDDVPWLSTANASVMVDTDNAHPTLAGHSLLAYRSAEAMVEAVERML